jgi:AcrR family transcriptional regulator
VKRVATAAPQPRSGGADVETRERLLKVASQLFAERGFSKVTVRDICRRARANVAAVNYHFGGKTGLYEEILRSAIRVMQGTTDAARKAGEHGTPEQQFEAYIAIFLARVFPARDSWIHQLMMREISDPTPALDLIYTEVIQPRMAYLTGIIATLLDCAEDDPRVVRCLMSVHAQILALLDSPLVKRFRPVPALRAEDIPVMARHITCFSLAGIRAIARS